MAEQDQGRCHPGGEVILGEMAKAGSALGSTGGRSGAKEKTGGTQGSRAHLHGVRPQADPLPSPACWGPCYGLVGQTGVGSRWRGNMGAALGSDKGMTQGPEGLERCLQGAEVRVMLPQIFSTVMWPSLGDVAAVPGQHPGAVLLEQSWAGPRNRFGEHSGVPLPLCLSPCQLCLCPQAPGQPRSSSPRPCTRRSVTAQRGRSRRGLVTQVGVGTSAGPFPLTPKG